MSDIINTSINKQQYTAPDAGNLTTGIKKVILTLTPKSILVSGCGDNGSVLAIRYADYKNVAADWIIDFFEHQFINEPLLNDTSRVTAICIGTEKNMIVPSTLYNAESATQWLKKMHAVENDDIVSSQQLGEENANYVYAWPQMIKDLAKRYFPKGKTYPMATIHFNKGIRKQEANIQCCLSNQHAYITIYKEDALQWHEVVEYSTPEDIAYRIASICKEKNVGDYFVNCSALNPDLILTINKLSQYFDVAIGENRSYMNQSSWEAVTYLSKQLYSCV